MDLNPEWEYVADRVMGGVSQGQATKTTVKGRIGARLTGSVSLDNNGGFIQIAFDLRPSGDGFDASEYTGVELDVIGNDETYDLRLRTDQLRRPWQSFRTDFKAPDEWTTIQFPFTQIEAHKTDASFDPSQLRRIGILAIGRAFEADVTVGAVRLYK